MKTSGQAEESNVSLQLKCYYTTYEVKRASSRIPPRTEGERHAVENTRTFVAGARLRRAIHRPKRRGPDGGGAVAEGQAGALFAGAEAG
ncbi:hypothetical protein KIN_28020 [Litoreibacter roseus]|uniref:Uncharacterized protein n=1 Tax=Litoreibacter roseus TaxID=2601869 RepID=A0A6N6JKC3_9RHOB|nr:hypothetical protein KIN_28020 [Litoreibacter roseus]